MLSKLYRLACLTLSPLYFLNALQKALLFSVTNLLILEMVVVQVWGIWHLPKNLWSNKCSRCLLRGGKKVQLLDSSLYMHTCQGSFFNHLHWCSNRCNISSIMLEVDRILRPGGHVYIRDTVTVMDELQEIANAMGWVTILYDTGEGPHASWKLLNCEKR